MPRHRRFHRWSALAALVLASRGASVKFSYTYRL